MVISRIRAFSLIELMVVIAIVALLVAVAVPTYKNFTNGARMAEISGIAHSFMQESIIYQSTNGIFPTARDLGYPEDSVNRPGQDEYLDPTGYSPYIFELQVSSSVTGTNCNSTNLGLVQVSVDTSALGFAPAVLDQMLINYWIMDNGSTKEISCVYVMVDDQFTFYATDPFKFFPGTGCAYGDLGASGGSPAVDAFCGA